MHCSTVHRRGAFIYTGVEGWLFVFRVVFCMGMSQRPSAGFRISSMMISLFLPARSVYLFKYNLQLSSHSCPIEISEALFRFGRIMAVDAFVDRWDDSGKTPDCADDMSLLFRRRTDGNVLS